MISERDLLPLSRLQHSGPPPWGNFRPSLFPPVTDGLDWEPGRVRYSFWASEGDKDVINCVHERIVSEKRISAQVGNYPKCVRAQPILNCDNIRMSDSVFDCALVEQKMKEQKVTQAALAKLLGLTSQSAMSNILRGKRKVTAQEAATIYRFLGLNLALPDNLQHVPIIGFTSAGNWREAIGVPMGIMSIPPKKAGPKAFALQVEGDSMDEIIDPGSYIVIDPDQKELHAGKCYLLQNGDGEVTVKCYRREPARFVPLSSNPAHQSFLVSERDMIILGRVVWKGGPM